MSYIELKSTGRMKQKTTIEYMYLLSLKKKILNFFKNMKKKNSILSYVIFWVKWCVYKTVSTGHHSSYYKNDVIRVK